MTCRAGIRCTQEAILALSLFLDGSDRTAQLQPAAMKKTSPEGVVSV